jgi:hypothetical protein
MVKNNTIPKWVLLDQIHIDVNIRSDMSPKKRKELLSLLRGVTMSSMFEAIIVGPDRNSVKVKVTR